MDVPADQKTRTVLKSHCKAGPKSPRRLSAKKAAMPSAFHGHGLATELYKTFSEEELNRVDLRICIGDLCAALLEKKGDRVSRSARQIRDSVQEENCGGFENEHHAKRLDLLLALEQQPFGYVGPLVPEPKSRKRAPKPVCVSSSTSAAPEPVDSTPAACSISILGGSSPAAKCRSRRRDRGACGEAYAGAGSTQSRKRIRAKPTAGPSKGKDGVSSTPVVLPDASVGQSRRRTAPRKNAAAAGSSDSQSFTVVQL